MKKVALYIAILLSLGVHIKGQDVLFSQFQTSSTRMNPSLAGDSDYGRLIAQNRMQWPSLGNKYYTSFVAYDLNLLRHHSGWGVNAMIDHSTFTTVSMSGQYSYTIQVNNRWYAKGGLSAGIANKSISYDDLKFVSQYDNYGFQGGSSGEASLDEKITYPLMDVGGFFYDQYNWIGFTISNVNMPNISMTGDVVRLPIRYSVHGGMYLPFDERKFTKRLIDKRGNVRPVSGAYPYIQYSYQSLFHMVDAGSSFYVYPFSFGAGFRINPFYVKESGYTRNVGYYLMAGYKNERLVITYNFDVYANKNIHKTGGGHEISLIYFLNYNGRKIGVGSMPLTPTPVNMFY